MVITERMLLLLTGITEVFFNVDNHESSVYSNVNT